MWASRLSDCEINQPDLQVLAGAFDLELQWIVFDFALDHGRDVFGNQRFLLHFGGFVVELEDNSYRLQLMGVTHVH